MYVQRVEKLKRSQLMLMPVSNPFISELTKHSTGVYSFTGKNKNLKKKKKEKRKIPTTYLID